MFITVHIRASIPTYLVAVYSCDLTVITEHRMMRHAACKWLSKYKNATLSPVLDNRVSRIK